MRLDNWVKVKSEPKKKQEKVTFNWRQVFRKEENEFTGKAYRVVKDIELMAVDNYGNVYPEVFRKGDIIAPERFDYKFFKLLVKYGIVEEVKTDEDNRSNRSN